MADNYGDLVAFSTGQFPSQNTGTNMNQQVQLVTLPNQGGCLPCDEQACPTITPIPNVNMDLNSIQSSTPSCVQWDTVNGTSVPLNLILMGRYTANNMNIYGLVNAKFAAVNSAFNYPLFTTNGNANALDTQYLNTVTGTGSIICSIELNIDTVSGSAAQNAANRQLANTILSIVRFPIDSTDGTCSKVDYSPFCSACVNNDNDGFVTKRYTLSAPSAIRSAIVIPFPALASATVRVCHYAIGIQNTNLAPAGTQY